jgi:hypothetical protein
MSRVINNNEKKALVYAGYRLDRIIHRRRRERDLSLKTIKFVRGK